MLVPRLSALKSRDFHRRPVRFRGAKFHRSRLQFESANSEQNNRTCSADSLQFDPCKGESLQLRFAILCAQSRDIPVGWCWGPVPVRLPATAPGNHSACFRVRRVSATVATRMCDIVWLRVLAISVSVLLSLSPCHGFRVGEVTGQSSRVFVACRKRVLFLRSRGRFPWWGGLLTPRHQGPPGRLSRGAGRPMGPSTPRCFFSKLCCSLLGI